MKKIFLSFIFAFVLFFQTGITTKEVQANDEIKVYVDGSEIEFNTEPFIKNESVLVPLRQIFEAIGADVVWDGATKTITATRDNDVVVLTIGRDTAYKNGESIKLSVSPQVVNGSTYVPLRFIAESFGANVDWVASEKTVYINSFYIQDDYDPNYVETEYTPYSTGDLETLLNAVANGNVVIIDGEYYATPEYATSIYHAFHVSNEDISDYRDGEYTEEMTIEDYDWISGLEFSEQTVNGNLLQGIDLSKLEKSVIPEHYYVYAFFDGTTPLYVVADMTDEFMSLQNGTGTFSGIDMEMEDGNLYFSIDDLIEKGVPLD